MQDRQQRDAVLQHSQPGLNRAHGPQSAAQHSLSGARTVALTSGKGGVGKSIVTLNLAIALAQAGERVCLLDANPGVSTQDLLCGLNGYWNLTHVFSQARELTDVLLTGPAGIHILPGAASLVEQGPSSGSLPSRWTGVLEQLERDYDFLVFDCGSGVSHTARQLATAVDRVLLLTTLELTSLAETYIAYRNLYSAGTSQVQLLINQATPSQAQSAVQNLRRTVRDYLQTELEVFGCLPHDPLLAHSIGQRKPFQTEHVRTVTGQMLAHLARMLQAWPGGEMARSSTPFHQRLQRSHRPAA